MVPGTTVSGVGKDDVLIFVIADHLVAARRFRQPSRLATQPASLDSGAGTSWLSLGALPGCCFSFLFHIFLLLPLTNADRFG
jgi:hypothetical protein